MIVAVHIDEVALLGMALPDNSIEDDNDHNNDNECDTNEKDEDTGDDDYDDKVKRGGDEVEEEDVEDDHGAPGQDVHQGQLTVLFVHRTVLTGPPELAQWGASRAVRLRTVSGGEHWWWFVVVVISMAMLVAVEERTKTLMMTGMMVVVTGGGVCSNCAG